MPGSRGSGVWARWLLLALSALGLATALYALSLPVVEVPRSHSQLPMLEGWWQLVRLHKLQPIASWLQMLSLGCVVLGAALAIALCMSRREDAALRRLRRALAIGAPAALYFVLLRPWFTPGLPLTLLLDPLGFAAGAGAAVDLTAFLAAFPNQPRLELINRYMERQVEPLKRFPALGRWRERANQALGSALGRLWPKLGSRSADAQAEIERSSRIHGRMLEGMQSRRLWIGAIGLGALYGILWAVTAGTPRNAMVVPGVALGVLPLAGFGGISINYQFGDDDARRRIGWLYLLPTFVFAVGAVAWVGGMVLSLLRGFDGSIQIAGMSADALALAGALLFFPVIVAAFLLSVALAVFYQGSLDPRLALRKGTAVALLGVMLTMLFVALEGAASAQIVTRFGWPDESGALIAGTLTAVGFAPLRSLIDQRAGRLVERLLPARDLADGHRESLTVCFVDVGGYTALAARDEHAALLLAGVLRKSARDAAERHGGRLVKTIGDAAMLCFPSPADALAGLRELRQRYGRGTAALEIEALPLHAGMHHGEVVVGRDGDLYGADVNLAARLQGAAGDGELLASESVLAGLGDWQGERRELRLKNVPLPVLAGVVDW